MYGLIGSFSAHPGKRDELIGLMTASVGDMPGCRSYVVAKDPQDPDKIWITEVWDSAEQHKASLALPEVAETIKKAMPLIASFGQHTVTEPVGGHGL
ncbi:antibiotic biosynthesis monooxygenase [Asticcacaulis sp. AC460]|uniref:putative quinol monooxygenase n=1 Tax=Asticcacaulis sp. AC460 TaxID=1282360 RepID=UPI0003C3B8B7|nr:putative quinol monooxygenase [Asticcacaulis sp. AC460]ESQ88221.1 antibiotic biosynthesis monooxygenase [Asticcacaulis sp. AC460]